MVQLVVGIHQQASDAISARTDKGTWNSWKGVVRPLGDDTTAEPWTVYKQNADDSSRIE